MSTSGSPEWESDPPYTAVSEGRRCRIVPIDLDGKHQRSEMGQTWAPFGAPLATAQRVAEFAPEGWSGKLQIRSSPPEVAPAVEKAASDPVISWTPFTGGKFAYEKRLRDTPDLSATEYRALLNLCTYADEHLRDARPGHARLGAHLGFQGAHAAKRAGRVVKALEAKGYLRTARRATSAGQAATYELGIPATGSDGSP